MASEQQAQNELSTDDSSCRLKCLAKRSQLDFEIEFFEQVLSRNPNYVDALRVLAQLLAEKGCYRRALQVDQRLAQLLPENPVVAYNLACSHAVLQQIPEALEALRNAFQHGYTDIEYLLNDPDLKPLHQHAGFRKILVGLLHTSPETDPRLV